MATLLLVRHGHTDAAGKRLTGWAGGVHLNEAGRQQAERLVERLDGIRVDAIVSSPLERCRETAAPLAEGAAAAAWTSGARGSRSATANGRGVRSRSSDAPSCGVG